MSTRFTYSGFYRHTRLKIVHGLDKHESTKTIDNDEVYHETIFHTINFKLRVKTARNSLDGKQLIEN